jgi:hypothetical protein
MRSAFGLIATVLVAVVVLQLLNSALGAGLTRVYADMVADLFHHAQSAAAR